MSSMRGVRSNSVPSTTSVWSRRPLAWRSVSGALVAWSRIAACVIPSSNAMADRIVTAAMPFSETTVRGSTTAVSLQNMLMNILPSVEQSSTSGRA